MREASAAAAQVARRHDWLPLACLPYGIGVVSSGRCRFVGDENRRSALHGLRLSGIVVVMSRRY